MFPVWYDIFRSGHASLHNCLHVQVGRARQFTPSDDDCYTTLKVDVVVVDSMSRSPYFEIGKTFTSATARVRLAPKLPKRALIPLANTKASPAPGKFSVVTYNLLADLYTNVCSRFPQLSVH